MSACATKATGEQTVKRRSAKKEVSEKRKENLNADYHYFSEFQRWASIITYHRFPLAKMEVSLRHVCNTKKNAIFLLTAGVCCKISSI